MQVGLAATRNVIVMPPEANYMLDLHTTRLALVPFTLALVHAALTDRTLFAQRLAANVPDNWSGPCCTDVLPMLAQSLEQKLGLQRTRQEGNEGR